MEDKKEKLHIHTHTHRYTRAGSTRYAAAMIACPGSTAASTAASTGAASACAASAFSACSQSTKCGTSCTRPKVSRIPEQKLREKKNAAYVGDARGHGALRHELRQAALGAARGRHEPAHPPVRELRELLDGDVAAVHALLRERGQLGVRGEVDGDGDDEAAARGRCQCQCVCIRAGRWESTHPERGLAGLYSVTCRTVNTRGDMGDGKW